MFISIFIEQFHYLFIIKTGGVYLDKKKEFNLVSLQIKSIL